jgi:hypothetical protein
VTVGVGVGSCTVSGAVALGVAVILGAAGWGATCGRAQATGWWCPPAGAWRPRESLHLVRPVPSWLPRLVRWRARPGGRC